MLGTLWFAAGNALAPARRTALLEVAREVVVGHALAVGVGGTAGVATAVTTDVTSTHAPVVVLRLLAERVEPAMALLAAVRAAWRQAAWGLAANPPRIWRS